jgi:hypothetical protein
MPLPPETTLSDVKIKIKQAYSNDNVRNLQQVVLKEGPVTFKLATIWEIIDPKSGTLHHLSLKIDSVDKRKAGWFAKPKKSITLDGSDPSEIERLYRFLKIIIEEKIPENATEELHIIGKKDFMKLENLLRALPDISSIDKIELLKMVFRELDNSVSDVQQFIETFKNADKEIIQHISIASRVVQYRKAYNQLQKLIDDSTTKESDLQKHLQENPWMFGSEYSELLDRRKWTRDESLDFMLRRTADGILEILEIKTPFREHLFLYDSTHDSYYPSAKLTLVIGQVMKYIEEIARSRDAILSKDGYETLKIRARIIIGRNGDEQQQLALRNFNSHLHGIEIFTYDQLLKISERILNIFTSKSHDVETIDTEDIPF